MHLITQYYQDPNTERQQELDYCLSRNLANPTISGVHLLLEKAEHRPDLSDTKVHIACIDRRLTFKAAFQYANEQLDQQPFCVANSDVFFDATLGVDLINHLLSQNVALCLSRHEFNGSELTKDENFARVFMANTQDAWILQAPVKHIDECDFPIGILGCDNAIAHRLLQAGYLPVNLGSRIVVKHFDVARGKSSRDYIGYHKGSKVEQTFPEEQGQYLVPDYDMVMSGGLDALADNLQFTPMEKYVLMCRMMSQKIRVKNR